LAVLHKTAPSRRAYTSQVGVEGVNYACVGSAENGARNVTSLQCFVSVGKGTVTEIELQCAIGTFGKHTEVNIS